MAGMITTMGTGCGIGGGPHARYARDAVVVEVNPFRVIHLSSHSPNLSLATVLRRSSSLIRLSVACCWSSIIEVPQSNIDPCVFLKRRFKDFDTFLQGLDPGLVGLVFSITIQLPGGLPCYILWVFLCVFISKGCEYDQRKLPLALPFLSGPFLGTATMCHAETSASLVTASSLLSSLGPESLAFHHFSPWPCRHTTFFFAHQTHAQAFFCFSHLVPLCSQGSQAGV